jgi:hypothetical protein
VGPGNSLLGNGFAHGDFFLRSCNKGHFVNKEVYVKSPSELKKTWAFASRLYFSHSSKANV